jgi:hypothetical protein
MKIWCLRGRRILGSVKILIEIHFFNRNIKLLIRNMVVMKLFFRTGIIFENFVTLV